jgi:hypothetical protein
MENGSVYVTLKQTDSKSDQLSPYILQINCYIIEFQNWQIVTTFI